MHAPERMIREVENSYQEHIRNVARNIAQEHAHAKIAMLSGPSSSGKTTTAHILQERLREFNIHSVIISLDNFYRGRGEAPLLPDGTRDYEALEALRVDKLKECLVSLVNTGKCSVPVYNFTLGRPEEQEQDIAVTEQDIVIIEGIHALNPTLTKELPEEKLIKLYVSVKQPIKDANGEVTSPLDLRLTRRIVRDVHSRGTTAETTLAMWPSVVAGEDKYIRPYRISADYTINTIHIFEPCVMRRQAIPLLREIPQDSPYYRKARDLESRLMRFEPIDENLVPEKSMLREFIGPLEK